jgi:serine/threonine protein kinase
MGSPQSKPISIGRYAVHGEIASGGMATVHLGRMTGHVGFSRTVAVKRLHAQFAKDPDFVGMFVDEARLAGRIRHPNVVPILDVISADGELCIVMEYVAGLSLGQMLRTAAVKKTKIPLRIICAILVGVLEGLQSAHDAVGEIGEPLGIVHRDVSPQNIQVGVDGLARVLDFGIAKAVGRQQTTREGQIKGKVAYMAPEQVQGLLVDRRTDVYAVAAVLWEALTGRRLFEADSQVALFRKVLYDEIPQPNSAGAAVPAAVEEIVMRGLERDPTKRFQSAEAMAVALEGAVRIASPREVGRLVENLGGAILRERSAMVADVESMTSQVNVPVAMPPPTDVGTTTTDPASDDARNGAGPAQGTQSAFHSAVVPSPAAPFRRHRWTLGAVALLVAGVGATSWLSFRSGNTTLAAAEGSGNTAESGSSTPAASKPLSDNAVSAPDSHTPAIASTSASAFPSPTGSTAPTSSSLVSLSRSTKTTAIPDKTKRASPSQQKNTSVPSVTDFGGRE